MARIDPAIGIHTQRPGPVGNQARDRTEVRVAMLASHHLDAFRRLVRLHIHGLFSLAAAEYGCIHGQVLAEMPRSSTQPAIVALLRDAHFVSRSGTEPQAGPPSLAVP